MCMHMIHISCIFQQKQILLMGIPEILTIFKYNYTCSYQQSSVNLPLINYGLEYNKLVGQCLTAVLLTTRSQIGHQVVTQAAPRGGTAEAAFPPSTAIEPGTCVCRGVFPYCCNNCIPLTLTHVLGTWTATSIHICPHSKLGYAAVPCLSEENNLAAFLFNCVMSQCMEVLSIQPIHHIYIHSNRTRHMRMPGHLFPIAATTAFPQHYLTQVLGTWTASSVHTPS